VTDHVAPGRSSKRILLRSPKDPFQVASPRTVLDKNLIGTNAGNLVFLQAAWMILDAPGVELTPDRLRVSAGLADEINERYDAYVIPLANAFRPSFEPILIRMTRLIERLRIPVVILGVGAQATLAYETERLRAMEPSVRAFVGAVLDRAPSIGVRGELTLDYLTGLGFRDVEVVGCPSMFLWGRDLRVEKRVERLEADAKIALNVSPYVKAMGPIVRSTVARYPNLAYIPQDLPTLQLLLWGESEQAAATVSDIPTHSSHPLFQENRVRFYVEPWPWIADLRTFDFSFGTRIHGNIASLLAGTPAYVFAHDSRTLELVRYFNIPHRPMVDVPPDVDPADLYEEADYGPLVAGHAARFEVFTAFLERHGLAHVFVPPGDGGRAFDERVARTSYPPAIDVASTVAHPGSPAARLRRLRYRLAETARSPRIRGARVAVLRRVARLTGRSRPAGDDAGPAVDD